MHVPRVHQRVEAERAKEMPHICLRTRNRSITTACADRGGPCYCDTELGSYRSLLAAWLVLTRQTTHSTVWLVNTC